VKKTRLAPTGPVAPIDQALDEAIAQARRLVTLLDAHDPGYSVKDRNRRLKLPSNNAGAIAPLLHLAKRNGLGAQAAPIEEHAGTRARLSELRVQITLAAGLASDIEKWSESATWQATTTIYTILRRLARRDVELEATLAPVVAKYFTRRRAVAPAVADGESAPKPAGAPAAKKRKQKRG
jgi:hypothetical protein